MHTPGAMRIHAMQHYDHHHPTATAGPTPSHIHAPPTSLTPTNQTGTIAILSSFALVLLLLSTLVHIYTRHSRLLSDDYAFYAAAVLALGELGTTLFSVARGLGKDVSLLGAEERREVENAGLAAQMLYLGSLGLSKVACGLVFVRLTPFEGVRRAAGGLVGAAGAWMVAGLVVEGVGCRGYMRGCTGYGVRWIYISVFDMVLEASLFGVSVYMVWSRAMSARAKYTVVGAFSCRLPNIALTLTRLLFLHTPASTSAIHTARIQATTQLSVGYTIVSCVIPYLRPLMQSYENDGTGHGREDTTFQFSDRSKGSKGSKGSGSGFEVGEVEGKGKGKAMELVLNDVGRLLGPEGPERPGVMGGCGGWEVSR